MWVRSRSLTPQANEHSIPLPVLRAPRAFLSSSTSSRPLVGTTSTESNGAASCLSALTDMSHGAAPGHANSWQRYELPPATALTTPTSNGLTDLATLTLVRRPHLPFVGYELDAARDLAASTEDAELFLYPGDRHLFADSSLPWYDAGAAALLTERVLGFLAGRRGSARWVHLGHDVAGTSGG